MQMIFGYDVRRRARARDPLRPGRRGARRPRRARARSPGDLGPALDRAFAHDGPSVVNVLTDPADAYPRSSNLGLTGRA